MYICNAKCCIEYFYFDIRTYTGMKNIISIIAILLFSIQLHGQQYFSLKDSSIDNNKNECRTHQTEGFLTRLFKMERTGNEVDQKIKRTITTSEVISIDFNQPIEALSVTGRAVIPHDDSFIRIVLEDDDSLEYIVLETCRLYNDVDTMIMNDYCEETKVLTDIHPTKLHIYMNNATLELSQIAMTKTIQLSQVETIKKNSERGKIIESNRYNQSKDVSERINQYNRTHCKLWRAEATEQSLMPWRLRKNLLNIGSECAPNGFEYYSSGIFEIGNADESTSNRSNSPYVDCFDWRNRHGKNWLTSVKNQGYSETCWTFAAVSVTEALVNLYYNDTINYDLSEQEVISCSGKGTISGGSESGALAWIAQHGISEETSFPFSGTMEPCSNKDAYDELITFQDTTGVLEHLIANNDSVKKALINHGPLTSGIQYISYSPETVIYNGHAMALVGYATLHAGDTIWYCDSFTQTPDYYDVIQENDSRIGKTYWIFKNSWGSNSPFDHQGYAYVLFHVQQCFLQPYYVSTPIYSLLYSDSDIKITDEDGDGYYVWGIGKKPANCQGWIPDEPDGDDSNYALGPIDEYGHVYDLSSHVADAHLITESATWTQKRYIYNNIVIVPTVTLTIENDVEFYDGAKITLAGGTLHVHGGKLNNAEIIVNEPII